VGVEDQIPVNCRAFNFGGNVNGSDGRRKSGPHRQLAAIQVTPLRVHHVGLENYTTYDALPDPRNNGSKRKEN
jgi:hypothetical protein